MLRYNAVRGPKLSAADSGSLFHVRHSPLRGFQAVVVDAALENYASVPAFLPMPHQRPSGSHAAIVAGAQERARICRA